MTTKEKLLIMRLLFLEVTPCCLVGKKQCLGQRNVGTYLSPILCRILEDHNLNIHSCDSHLGHRTIWQRWMEYEFRYFKQICL